MGLRGGLEFFSRPPPGLEESPVKHKRSALGIILSLLLVTAGSASSQGVSDKDFVTEARDYLNRLSKLGLEGVVFVARDGDVLMDRG